jgi:hypothetical protein
LRYGRKERKKEKRNKRSVLLLSFLLFLTVLRLDTHLINVPLLFIMTVPITADLRQSSSTTRAVLNYKTFQCISKRTQIPLLIILEITATICTLNHITFVAENESTIRLHKSFVLYKFCTNKLCGFLPFSPDSDHRDQPKNRLRLSYSFSCTSRIVCKLHEKEKKREGGVRAIASFTYPLYVSSLCHSCALSGSVTMPPVPPGQPGPGYVRALEERENRGRGEK